MKRYEEILRLYDAYVDEYRDADGKLPKMMQLKRTHTAFVVRNAREIAEGEGFAPELLEAALVAALLHDTGRYEQLRLYDTFRDSDSVDHAVFSHKIVCEKGWVADKAILDAILFHNRRELPDALDERTLKLSHIVRDADKLDIFRVLEAEIAASDWRKDSRAFWNLSIDALPNPAVVKAIMERRPVDYQNIKSLSDFVLIQVGWMVSGLHYATSRRLCRERGHLAFRRDFLHKLTDSPEIDRIADFAAAALGASAPTPQHPNLKI